MSRDKRFYQITQNGRIADINIYGDITSFEWYDSDVSAHTIKTEIDALDVDVINVYINSYGGEVAEALAIYSALRRHNAKIHTFCDGFACSAATIIFCAGDDRTMGSIALFMIHNCMGYLGYANSLEMRKTADDIDKINQSSIEAYKKVSSLSEEDIKAMMDAETWLTAPECLEYGFATEIAESEDGDDGAQQSAFASVREAVLSRQNINLSTLNEKIDRISGAVNALTEMTKPVELKYSTGESLIEITKKPEEKEEPERNETEEPEKTKETLKQKAARLFGSMA